MESGTVNCPVCGAATSADELSTHCGAAAVRTDDPPLSRCPRCRIEMRPDSIGSTAVGKCERCRGLWLDVSSFEDICADRKRQAAVLGAASSALIHVAYESKVRYSPCPQCERLMNRINFDRANVVVDICKGHGIWFDRDELTRIVEFLRAGNFGEPHNRHKTELENERIRTHRAMTKRFEFGQSSDDYDYPWYHTGVAISSVADVLNLLRD